MAMMKSLGVRNCSARETPAHTPTTAALSTAMRDGCRILFSPLQKLEVLRTPFNPEADLVRSASGRTLRRAARPRTRTHARARSRGTGGGDVIVSAIARQADASQPGRCTA